MGRDDLDLYGSGLDRGRVARGILRTLAALVGIAMGLYGVALYVLRCFDTCPTDPSLDRVWQMLSGALVLAGVAVVVEAVSFRTRAARPAGKALAALGTVITVLGIVSLATLPSVDAPVRTEANVVPAVLAIVVGSAFAIAHRPRRGSGTPH